MSDEQDGRLDEGDMTTERTRNRRTFLRSAGTTVLSAALVVGSIQRAHASDPKHPQDNDQESHADDKVPTDRDGSDPAGHTDNDRDHSADPKNDND